MVRVALLAVVACGGTDPAPPSAAVRRAAEPPPPTCVVIADHVRRLIVADSPAAPPGDRARNIRDALWQRCEQDAWSADVRWCIANTMSLAEPRNCKAILSADHRAALEADLEIAEHANRPDGIPPACLVYKATVARVTTCDNLPAFSRASLRRSLSAMVAAWDNPSVSDDERKTMDEACRASTEALQRAAAAMCGW